MKTNTKTDQILRPSDSLQTIEKKHGKESKTVPMIFRTDDGADDFAKLHSIAETAMKNGNSKFNAILAVVQQ